MRSSASRLLAALLLVATALLPGCQRGGPSPGAFNVALALFPSEAHRYQLFAAGFERRYHVHLNLVAQSYGDILRALQAEGGAKRGALDLVELDLATLGEAKPYVRPLDNVVSAQALHLFPQAAWAAARFGGHLYFVPHRLMWEAMIYNHVMVPKPPATWDELRRFARAHPGKFALKGALYEGAICDVMPFVWDAGGSELDPASPGSLAALDFLASLAPDLNRQSQIFREMSVLEAQARGLVWIHFNWPFAMDYLASKGLAPSVDRSAPLPAGPNGAFSVLGGGYLAIPRSAPHRALAEDFIRYLLEPQTQHLLSRELGWYGSVPPPPGSRQAMLYAGFNAMRSRVRARPPVPNYSQLSNRWQRTIRAVLFDRTAPKVAVADQWGNREASAK